MFKFIRITIKLLLLFTIISSISVICLVTFVDPNNYKPQITEYLERFTKRKVSIKGNIQWALTPNISLSVQNLTVFNNKPFNGALLSARVASADVSLKDLLQGKITVGGLRINGLSLRYSKHKEGKTNLDDLFALTKSGSYSSDLDKNIAKASARTLRFESIVLQKARLIMHDEISNESIIANGDFEAKDLVLNKFVTTLTPMKFKGQLLKMNDDETKSAQISGVFQANTSSKQVKLTDFEFAYKEIYSKINGNVNFADGMELNGKITASIPSIAKVLKAHEVEQNIPELINLDVSASVSASKEELEFDSYRITINNKESLNGHGKLNATSNKVSALAQTETVSSKTLHDLNIFWSLMSDIYNSTDTNDTSYNIKLIADKFNVEDKLQINNLTTTLKYENKNLIGEKLNAELFKATANGNYSVDFSKLPSVFETKISLDPLDLKEITKKLTPNNVITGQAQVELNLKSNGLEKHNLTNDSIGEIEFTIQDGEFYGVDITKQLQVLHDSLNSIEQLFAGSGNTLEVNELLSRVPVWEQNTSQKEKTPFQSFTGKISFDNGKYNLEKTTIIGNTYKITGNGKLNNNSSSLTGSFLLTNAYKNKESSTLKVLHTSKLPITLSGTIAEPKVTGNTKEFMKKAIEALHSKAVRDAAEATIQSIINNDPSNQKK